MQTQNKFQNILIVFFALCISTTFSGHANFYFTFHFFIRLNSTVKCVPYNLQLTSSNALEIIEKYPFIFTTLYLLSFNFKTAYSSFSSFPAFYSLINKHMILC